MAILTPDDLVAALVAAQQPLPWSKYSSGLNTFTWNTLWAASGLPGAGSLSVGNTTTGVVPTDATQGAFAITDPTGTQSLYLARFNAQGEKVGVLALYDRLWHAGNFSLTTLQTYSLTPAALTRPDATGADTELWLEITTGSSGSQATTVSISYTNSDGTAGRTATPEITPLTSTNSPVNKMIACKLQAGDSGVQSVQSVTIGGVAQSTAGAFNVVILRRLAEYLFTLDGSSNVVGSGAQDPFAVGLPSVYGDSCLAFMWMPQSAMSANIGLAGELALVAG